MGYQGIAWLERPERESEEHLTQLVDSIKLAPGMVVADIGAGSGVISLKMAKKIGPTGTVMAVDIQEEMLSVLSKRLKQLNGDQRQAGPRDGQIAQSEGRTRSTWP